jgi:type II secretory pathway pseudopilin PulG
MNRVIIYVVLPIVVAAASIYNVAEFWLSNLLREDFAPVVKASRPGAVAVIVIAALGIFFASRGTRLVRRLVLVLGLVIIVVAGFVPRGLDFLDRQQRTVEQQSASADAEMQFQSDYLDRSDELDDRIAGKRPFTAEEALAFLDFVASADLSWRSLPDHTPEAFTLLGQALDAGILDPNTVTTAAPTADSPAMTVTLAYYDKAIRPTMPRAVERHAWDVVKALVDHGADISSPDAAQLREYLSRTPTGEGRYIQFP